MPAPPGPDPTRHRRWPALLALGLGIVLIVVFGLRAWHQLQFDARVQSGEVQVETLRGWMTLPYIARVYGVPQADLRATLGLPASGHDGRSLRDWFDTAGLDPVVARQRIEALILARPPAASGTAR